MVIPPPFLTSGGGGMMKIMDTNEILTNLREYGAKYRMVEGQEYEDTAFMGFRKMKEAVDFKRLDKGCETWIKDEKYPMRVYIDVPGINDRMLQVARVKKIFPIIVGTLKGGLIRKVVAVLYLKWNWESYLNFIWNAWADVYMDCDRYSQPVREVYRVMEGKLRDIICAILEFDTAYRYRFQDIVGELNKEAFEKNPLKEIKRLADILFEREWHGDNGIGKFKKYIPYLIWYLRLNPKLVSKLKEIVRELNVEEIKLSKEDIYWTNSGYEDYNFRGLSSEIRLKEYESERNKI